VQGLLRDSLDEISASRTNDCSGACSNTIVEETQAYAAAASSTTRAGTEAEDVLSAEASIFRFVGDDTLSLIEDGLLQISPKTLQIRGPLRKLDPVGI